MGKTLATALLAGMMALPIAGCSRSQNKPPVEKKEEKQVVEQDSIPPHLLIVPTDYSKIPKITFKSQYDDRLLNAIYEDIYHQDRPVEILNDSTYRRLEYPDEYWKMRIEDQGIKIGRHMYKVEFESPDGYFLYGRLYSVPVDTTKKVSRIL